MANVIIKSDERRETERRVMSSFAVRPGDSAAREAAEVIAARSHEAYSELRRMEDRSR
jgi:hypothetical protein